MYAVLTCLQQHDPRELVWAVLICLSSVSAGLGAYRRARLANGGFRLAWLALLGFLLGSGVWATHFMAMLAYQQQMSVVFGFRLTLISLLIAFAGFSGGAAVAAYASSVLGRLAGGALCGLAIAAMHFTGVWAMRMPAEISWDHALVAVSILLGVTFSAAAFLVASGPRRLGSAVAAVGLMAAAICGLHFTAMAAVTLTPAPMSIEPGLYGREGLRLGVGVLTGAILISGAGVMLMEGMGKATTLSALSAALNQLPCAIGFFDRNARLTFWNESYAELARLYGIEPQRALRADSMLSAASEKGLPTRPGGWDSVVSSGLDEAQFEPFRAPDGRWLEVRSARTRDGGCVTLLNDVTAHRDLLEQQAQAKALAEQVSRSKSEFLANTSHEIRTPLNALLGMVQVMERHPLDSEQRRRLQLVSESGKSLLAVLNSVLDLAKIEAGKLELDEHPFDLAQTVNAAVAGFAPLAAQKELAFTVEIEPAAAGAWRGDSDRLRQVLSNLVSNAIKFTHQGRVAVGVACLEDGLRFVVEDTGVGVAPEKQDLIFEAFAQADASTTREFGGTGLGLAICASLVRTMNGRMDLHSAAGQGSRFAFVLPLQRLEAADMAVTAEPVCQPADLPLRILVAEDNANNQLVLSALLEPFGAVLTMAGDGCAAVEAYLAGDYDVILMDAQMPRMNGVEAAREIRRLEGERGLPRAPIIALTANVMNHQVQEYLAAGMDAFVGKPIDLAELIEALSRVPPRALQTAA